MEALFPFGILVVFAIAIITGVVLHHRAEKKRAEEIAGLAEQLGLQHYPQGDPELLQRLSRFELFSKGRRRTIVNMLHGKAEGVDLALFDYSYVTGSGKNKRTYRQTVVYIRADDLNAPEFALGPENFLHRIGQFFGMRDINFDEYPTFSANFLLRGPNEEAIRDYFNEERVKFLENNPLMSLEAHGNQLAVFRTNHRQPTDQMQALMSIGFDVYTRFREPGA